MIDKSFCVKIHPVAKLRHRLTTVGGYARMHPAKKSFLYEQELGALLLQEAQKCRLKPLEKEAVLYVTFMLQKPKSVPKKVLHNVKKPDLDNLVKSFMDAANGILFIDDRIVHEIHASKQYTNEESYIFITIKGK